MTRVDRSQGSKEKSAHHLLPRGREDEGVSSIHSPQVLHQEILLAEQSLPMQESLAGVILPSKPSFFSVLRPADAQRLDLNGSRGISQDYFNCFNRLIFPFDPSVPEELQQYYVARVVEHIANFPRYEDHMKHLIKQTGVRVSVEDVLREAEEHGTDLSVFDRITAHIKEIGLSPTALISDPDTQMKIFQLRLWVYLAGEVIYGWGSQNDEHLSILRVEPAALQKHHQTYDETLFRNAA